LYLTICSFSLVKSNASMPLKFLCYFSVLSWPSSSLPLV
jgi:hypothetical protein